MMLYRLTTRHSQPKTGSESPKVIRKNSSLVGRLKNASLRLIPLYCNVIHFANACFPNQELQKIEAVFSDNFILLTVRCKISIVHTKLLIKKQS